MNTQYSQGPWRIGDAGHTIFGPPNGNPSPEVIATLKGGNPRANARLIAAAPDLLAALGTAQVQMREFVDWHHKFAGGCSVEFEDATEIVEDAIRQGQGITPMKHTETKGK